MTPSQSTKTEDVRPPRKILAVVTVGRFTCAAPIIEICRVLHTRGHEIQFAVLEGWEKLTAPHQFISKVHLVGRDLTVAEDDELYSLLDSSVVHSATGRKSMFRALGFMMQWWPETYEKIKQVCIAEKPDFLLSDLLADACLDVSSELNIPLAMHYPQMPAQMLPSPYIPGMPGMQLKHLTSENASLWDRMVEELVCMKLKISAMPYAAGRRKQRTEAGVKWPGFPPAKPNYLVFVNSFFGLEIPKDLPPLVRTIGPVLADEYPEIPPDGPLASFLSSHRRVLYVSFGSHLETPGWRKRRMIQGIHYAIKDGYIDGVIWAMKPVDRPQPKPSFHDEKKDLVENPVFTIDYDSILEGRNPDWLMTLWVPQRAILSHPSTLLYLTHCGASSTMESAFHGIPVIAMPIDGDQLGNGKRLESAGVAVRLDKNSFSAEDLTNGIKAILRDVDGSFSRNSLRLRRLAHANSSGKEVAARMIEETIYDRELAGDGEDRRPHHLQTCDARMPWYKRGNLDMWPLFPVCLPFLILASWLKHGI